MKIINKNGESIEVIMDLSAITTEDEIFFDVESILVDCKILAIPDDLEYIIYNIGYKCDLIVDLNKTDFKIYISRKKEKVAFDLFIEVFPIIFNEDRINNKSITFNGFNFSESFYNNPEINENTSLFPVIFTALEIIELKNLISKYEHDFGDFD